MKKKVALSATAIAVLASTVPTHVALVQAEEAREPIYVDSTKASDNDDFTGKGTEEFPYRQLSTALDNAEDGDTIIIVGAGYVNDLWKGAPWYINKSVTIKGQTKSDNSAPVVSVRTPGIILGADVTFENIALGLPNKVHDAIFANGHKLNLINVAQEPGTRLVDLFAGGLAGANQYLAGDTPSINIVVNSDYKGGTQPSKFGGIYAGSMGTGYDKDSTITVSNTWTANKLEVEGIYSSGGVQAPDDGNFLDATELPIQADPRNCPNSGNVNVTLEGYLYPTVDGDTGSTSSKTNVTIKNTTKATRFFNPTNIDSLDLELGQIKLNSPDLEEIPRVRLNQGTVLDLTSASGLFVVQSLEGQGTLILGKEQTVYAGNKSGHPSNINLAVTEYFSEKSGEAKEGHTYLVTDANVNVSYVPKDTQSWLGLYKEKTEDGVNWTVMDNEDIPEDDGEEELTLTGLQVIGSNTVDIHSDQFSSGSVPTIEYTLEMETSVDLDIETWLDEFEPTIEVGDYQATLEEDDLGYYYRVKELNLNLRFEPIDGGDLQHQKMIVEFVDEEGSYIAPIKPAYEIKISKDTITPVTLTLNIEGLEEEPVPDPEQPPKPPQGGDGDGDGEGGDDGDGDQDPEPPAPTKPAVSQFTESVYSQVSKGDTQEISTEFQVEFTESIKEEVEFQDLFNSQVFYGEQELQYDAGKGGYITSDGNILEIETTEVGKYTATLKEEDGSSLREGKKEFRLVANGKEATLSFEIKSIITGFTAEGETEKEFESTAFLGQDGQQPFFTFKASHSHDLKELDTFEDFKVTINDEDTDVAREGDGSKLYYYARDQKVKARIFYNEEDDTYELYLETFEGSESVEPELDKYVVKLSHTDINDLTFTANVKEQEEPPAPPIEPTQPVVTTVNFTSDSSTIPNSKAFEANYKFNVETEGNAVLDNLRAYPFTFTVDGKVSEYREESDSHYLEDLGLTFRVVPLSGDNQFQLVVSGNSQTLSTGNNPITVGIKDKVFSKDLSLIVEQPTPPPPTPELPDEDEEEVVISNLVVSNQTAEVKANDTFQVAYGLTVVDSKNGHSVGLGQGELDLTLGGSKAEYRSDTDDYFFADKGLTAKLHRVSGEGTYQLVLSGISHNLQLGNNTLTVAVKGTSVSADLTIVVKQPTITEVTFPQGPTKTVNVSDATAGVEFPFEIVLDGKADFDKLGYTVSLNGQVLKLEGVEYISEDTGLHLALRHDYAGKAQAFLFKQGTDGEQLPLPAGTYNISAVNENSKDFEFSIVVKDDTPTTPTPPSGTTPPSGSINPPSGGSGNTGGSSSGGTVTPPPSTGGGTTLPAPDPKPEKPSEKPPVVDKPTPQPPQQEETKPTTRPTVKPGAIASAVEALEDLATTIKEKVDSLLTEVIEQAKGLVLDLTGDKDDLSSVSTLEVTNEGVFANVDGKKVKFAADLKLKDMSKLRITRTDGSPIPYTTDGKGFKIDTDNFGDILITERVVEPFVDVAKDDWFQPYVDEMYNRGITTGTTATTFNPNASITRAQLAALLARTYELKPTGEKPVLTDTADQWYAADVQALVDLGIIKGYGDGTFRGDEPITREHLAIMLQRLAEKLGKDANHVKESNFTDTAKMSAEGKSAVQWAAEQGIINSGQGTAFKPKSDATRAQVAKMLTLFINK